MHDDQCYTLFSASNYCGDAGNDGAIMVFRGGIHWNHHPSEIHPYSAPRLDVEKGQTMAEIEEAERQKREQENGQKSGSFHGSVLSRGRERVKYRRNANSGPFPTRNDVIARPIALSACHPVEYNLCK